MGVIGLKGFLTDEHHSWVVVAAGDSCSKQGVGVLVVEASGWLAFWAAG